MLDSLTSIVHTRTHLPCTPQVFLLDSFTTIWVWIGSQSNGEESTMAMQAADAHIKRQRYDPLTPVVAVKSGSEPAFFTCHFLGWDPALSQQFVDPYAAKLAAIAAGEAASLPAGSGDVDTLERKLSLARSNLKRTPSSFERSVPDSSPGGPSEVVGTPAERTLSFARLRKTPDSVLDREAAATSPSAGVPIERGVSFDRANLRKTPTERPPPPSFVHSALPQFLAILTCSCGRRQAKGYMGPQKPFSF